jgi:hypothetical protein
LDSDTSDEDEQKAIAAAEDMSERHGCEQWSHWIDVYSDSVNVDGLDAVSSSDSQPDADLKLAILSQNFAWAVMAKQPRMPQKPENQCENSDLSTLENSSPPAVTLEQSQGGTSSEMDAEPRQRPTRWGRCALCQRALQPHIYRTGLKKGQCRLLCNGFWSFSMGRRRCWYDKELTRHQWIFLPDHFKRELREIKASLNRNAVRK